jgi:hypothetical protein
MVDKGERRRRCWNVIGNAAITSAMKRIALQQNASANDAISYSGYRFRPM